MTRPSLIAACLGMFFAGAPSPAAQPQADWIRHYDGPASLDDAGRQIALGPQSTLTVVGPSDVTVDVEDIATVRYDVNGNLLWSARWNGAFNGRDVPIDVDVDTAGNAFVTGRTFNGNDWDYVVIKYDSGGNEEWVYQYDGPGHRDDYSAAIITDESGSAYVAGYAFVELGPFSSFKVHFHVARYSPRGELLWQILYDLPTHWGARARDVQLDPDGNLLVTGQIDARAEGAATLQDDMLTMKISPEGAILWQRTWDSGVETNYDDDSWAVRADHAGNVYVLGTQQSEVFSQNFNATIVKYSADGTFEWSTALDFDREEVFVDLVADAAGNTYLAGGWDNAADSDAIIASYAPDGTQRWLHVLDGAIPFGYQNALKVMAAPNGLFYFGLDWDYKDAGISDPTILVVQEDGTIVDQWRFDSGLNTNDTFFVDHGGFEMDPLGNIVIGGYTDFLGSPRGTRLDFTALKVAIPPGACDTPPDEVSGVGFPLEPGRLEWEAAAIGTRYDISRGALEELGAGTPSCLGADIAVNWHSTTETPVPGHGYYYSVRGSNACGQGPWGVDSGGGPRASGCP